MTNTEQLLTTALHDWHSSNGGRMVEFAGWSMPVQYSSIIDEHNATRNSVGLFDVSHMGRFFFEGENVVNFLDRLTTRRVSNMEMGRIRYSLMTNEGGGILDDVLVYHLPGDAGRSQIMMVVNASNRAKIAAWIESNRTAGTADAHVELRDRTEETAMIACQGPNANGLVAEICDIDPAGLKYYTGTRTKVCGSDAFVSRTGYTGEDGCELIVENDVAVEIWEELHHRALAIRGLANGLAARDTLRLEAAMPLYGHELGEEINAAQTGLSFAMNFKERDFVGCDAIRSARKLDGLLCRVGIELSDRRAARQHCPVIRNDKKVGEVTSGTFSPTLQKSICMAYVEPENAHPDTELTIDIRGKMHTGKVVELPFYSRG